MLNEEVFKEALEVMTEVLSKRNGYKIINVPIAIKTDEDGYIQITENCSLMNIYNNLISKRSF